MKETDDSSLSSTLFKRSTVGAGDGRVETVSEFSPTDCSFIIALESDMFWIKQHQPFDDLKRYNYQMKIQHGI